MGEISLVYDISIVMQLLSGYKSSSLSYLQPNIKKQVNINTAFNENRYGLKINMVSTNIKR